MQYKNMFITRIKPNGVMFKVRDFKAGAAGIGRRAFNAFMITEFIGVILVSVLCAVPAWGEGIASVEYVNKSVSDKVDTSASTNQTMQGNYTVSGTLTVPTPPLPPEQ